MSSFPQKPTNPTQKTVIIFPGSGNLKGGFAQIDAVILDKNHRLLEIAKGKLPPNPNLHQQYSQLQTEIKTYYSHQLSPRKLTAIPNQKTNFSSKQVNLRAYQFTKQFQTWLNSRAFQPIKNRLYQILSPGDLIQIVISTNRPQVQQLPWHLFPLLDDYPYAEISYGLPTHKTVNSLDSIPGARLRQPLASSSCRAERHLKVLSILGDSEGINVGSDRQTLEKQPFAKLKILQQPTCQELSENLWHQLGWDILTFSGHTETKNGEGLIYLNQTETLTIPQLKYALKYAIQRGLKLAIFNSCQGLGLARQLGELQIPQIVVMREIVPDAIAQEFINYFFQSFSQKDSCHIQIAMRQAREKLQGLENELPCASWLPVMFQGLPSAI